MHIALPPLVPRDSGPDLLPFQVSRLCMSFFLSLLPRIPFYFSRRRSIMSCPPRHTRVRTSDWGFLDIMDVSSSLDSSSSLTVPYETVILRSCPCVCFATLSNADVDHHHKDSILPITTDDVNGGSVYVIQPT